MITTHSESKQIDSTALRMTLYCQISKMVRSHSLKSKIFVSKNVVICDSLNDLFNRSPKATVTYNYCLFLMITVYNNEETKHNKVSTL